MEVLGTPMPQPAANAAMISVPVTPAGLSRMSGILPARRSGRGSEPGQK